MTTPNISYSYRVGDAAPAPSFFKDGVLNVVNGIGTRKDVHSSASTWGNEYITQQEIENSYKTSWTSRKVHEIIPNDVVRPWRKWLTDPKYITAIEAEERRLGLIQKVRKALLLSRIYGGSAILLGIAGDDPSLPLEVEKIKKGGLSYIHVFSRHELSIQGINLDPGSPQYGEPNGYIVKATGNSIVLHPSRVVRFTHGDLPDSMAFANQGWGQPLLLTLRSALLNADVAQAAFAALPVKARTSILSIPGLTEKASTAAGEQQLIGRMTVAGMAEGMFNTTLLSGPSRTGEIGETLDHNQITWNGIAEVGTWFIQMVAAASDIPLTRFGSISPGGLNSTGDADLANYHANLDASRELDLRPRMEMIDEALLRSALGQRPSDAYFEWQPFEVDSEATRAANAKLRADAIKTLSDSATVPSEVLAKAVKGVLIDSGEYPGIEDAYSEYEAAGGDLAEIEPPARAANDNPVLAAATEGLAAQGKSASVAARDAAIMLSDAEPMTLYASRAVTNFADIRAHFEAQGVTVSVPDDKAHVTLAYSRQPVDWVKVGADDWGSSTPGLTIQSGGPRIMEVFNGTLVQIFASSQLYYRHESILRAGASWDHADFNPHFSLNYDFGSASIEGIKPWLGPIELGFERFEKLDEDWSANNG